MGWSTDRATDRDRESPGGDPGAEYSCTMVLQYCNTVNAHPGYMTHVLSTFNIETNSMYVCIQNKTAAPSDVR